MPTLIKNQTRTLEQMTEPGRPGSPAVAPYCIWEERVDVFVNHYAHLVASEYSITGGGLPAWVLPVETMDYVEERSETRTMVRTCFPGRAAVPAVPPKPLIISIDMNQGWNAGARSVASFSGDVYYWSNTTTEPRGVRTGFTDGTDSAFGVPVIKYGVEIFDARAYLVVNDERVHSLGPVPRKVATDVTRVGSEIFVVLYDPNDGFQVLYEAFITPEMMTSAHRPVNPASVEGETLWAGAVLFIAGDGLTAFGFDEPYIAATNRGFGALELAGITASGLGDGLAYDGWGQFDISPLRLTGLGANMGAGALTLAPLDALGLRTGRAFGSFEVAPIRVFGDGSQRYVYNFAAGYLGLSPINAAGTGTTGGVGSGEVVLRPLALLGADRPYAFGSALLAPLKVTGLWGAKDKAVLWSGGLAAAWNSAGNAALAVLRSDAQVSDDWAASVVALVFLEARGELVSQLSAAGELAAELISLLHGLGLFENDIAIQMPDGSWRPVDLSEGWAVNAETQASSEYTDYGFTSFAELNGVLYGCKPDGVYRLDGGDDAGRPIRSSVALGRLRSGASTLKHLGYVYATTPDGGAFELDVTTPQGEWTYPNQHRGPGGEAVRFSLGRGLRATYYDLTLRSADEVAYLLDSIELLHFDTKRRVGS